jgi:hypothetical protein
MLFVEVGTAEAKRLKKFPILMGLSLAAVGSLSTSGLAIFSTGVLGSILTLHGYTKPRPIPHGVRLFGFRLTRE